MEQNPNQDKNKINQKLRIRRWMISLTAYGVVIIAAYLAQLIGYGSIKPGIFTLFIFIAATGNAVFYYLFRTGKNLKFKDPSLTLIQMVFGFCWGIIPLYFLPNARLVVQLFYLTGFCFGIFRLNLRDYFKAFFSLIFIYISAVILDYLSQRPDFTLSLEVFQFILFTLILLWFTFFGTYISELRHRLQVKNAEITDAHKALQEESRQRQFAIEERMKMEDQLRRAKKMEAIGILAGGVAHDLNNILTGILSYPDLLLLDLPENSPLADPLKTIKQSGERAAAVVQDLLTLARRNVPVREVVEVNQVILDYLESPEYENLKLFHPDIEIKTGLQSDLLNILGSRIHIAKIIMNLVSNSVEAMPKGGYIKISTKNQYIDQSLILFEEIIEGDYVVLSVEDSGTGLTLEERDRIFEPFYTKKIMGRSGTGLGMSVVWGSVKDHNGYIDIETIKGNGTRISVYLPASRESTSVPHSTASITEYSGNGEKILLVDDVREQREIVSKMLTRLGYTVETVSSGEEAVEYLKENTVDLLLLDMIMDPGIDGLDTYRQVLEIHPGQKAVICSGFAETDRVREALRLGAGTYVKKPFFMDQIGQAVKEELLKKR